MMLKLQSLLFTTMLAMACDVEDADDEDLRGEDHVANPSDADEGEDEDEDEDEMEFRKADPCVEAYTDAVDCYDRAASSGNSELAADCQETANLIYEFCWA